jgi:hypothetical protein
MNSFFLFRQKSICEKQHIISLESLAVSLDCAAGLVGAARKSDAKNAFFG